MLLEEFRLPTTLTGRQQIVELVKTQLKALKMLELVQDETDPIALEQAERRLWQLTLSAAAQNEIVRELVHIGVATKGAAAQIKYPSIIAFPADAIGQAVLDRSTLLGDWKTDFVWTRVSFGPRGERNKETSALHSAQPGAATTSFRAANADGAPVDPRMVQSTQWDRKLADKDKKQHHFPKIS